MCCWCIILQHLTPMINPDQMVSLKDLHWRIIRNISACISGVADIKLTQSSLLSVSNFLFISFRDQQYWKTWIEMVILYYVAITLDRIYTQNMWELSKTYWFTFTEWVSSLTVSGNISAKIIWHSMRISYFTDATRCSRWIQKWAKIILDAPSRGAKWF